MNCQPDPFICIKNELENYSANMVIKFSELFPAPTNSNYYVLVGKILVKGRSVGATTLHHDMVDNFRIKVYFKDTVDFWYRWNRFKKITKFI